MTGDVSPVAMFFIGQWGTAHWHRGTMFLLNAYFTTYISSFNHTTSTILILSRSTMFLLNAYLDVRKAAKTPNVRILGMGW